MVEREGEVDEELVGNATRLVILLHDVVDVGDDGADEERENECNDVVAARPDVDVDGVEDGEEGETPADAVDDDVLAVGRELVDDGAKEQEVNEGPDAERPGRRGDVGLLARRVGRGGPGDGVNVGAEEEEVDDDVRQLRVSGQSDVRLGGKRQRGPYFEEDAILPVVSHGVEEVVNVEWFGEGRRRGWAR